MIYNLGSINADHVYRLARLPAPGETVAAESYSLGLGGKGANQSVAIAKSGGKVRHIGAVGGDGRWMVERLEEAGVDCTPVLQLEAASGHAIITVDAAGENAIVIHAGANRAIAEDHVKQALAEAGPGDALILQNETGLQVETARLAQEQGLFVVYSAAPFEAEAARAVLPYLSLLIVNELEAAQLCAALGITLDALEVENVLVTLGARGAVWHDLARGHEIRVPGFAVEAVDTTGAGDTYAGYLLAGLSEGLAVDEAMRVAAAAAALQVTRPGAAEAIPTGAEVAEFLAAQPSA
ncbi:ribokinase [Thioclava atlantica]|uniref:Ribokinase n=1 Tax=Thioclava atlantica TaxID=1317124 RepID=A0A085TWT3_9RHOB|nr:ribokinase [Thioclava atlantica]KFE35180.1 ribokinase [Thioclava atlantica]